MRRANVASASSHGEGRGLLNVSGAKRRARKRKGERDFVRKPWSRSCLSERERGDSTRSNGEKSEQTGGGGDESASSREKRPACGATRMGRQHEKKGAEKSRDSKTKRGTGETGKGNDCTEASCRRAFSRKNSYTSVAKKKKKKDFEPWKGMKDRRAKRWAFWGEEQCIPREEYSLKRGEKEVDSAVRKRTRISLKVVGQEKVL